VDVTWSSGYGTGSYRKFVKNFNQDYYLATEDAIYDTHVGTERNKLVVVT
jgi:hypothetical protein